MGIITIQTIQKYISHQQNGQGIGILEGHAGMTIPL